MDCHFYTPGNLDSSDSIIKAAFAKTNKETIPPDRIVSIMEKHPPVL